MQQMRATIHHHNNPTQEEQKYDTIYPLSLQAEETNDRDSVSWIVTADTVFESAAAMIGSRLSKLRDTLRKALTKAVHHQQKRTSHDPATSV